MDSETSTDIRANLERVQAVIAAACRRAGRSPDDVLVVAVSKTMPAERVKAAVEAGAAALGENRVQEAKDKIEALGHPVPWHLIGHLQTNKAKDAVRLFDCIQSVDRLDLAREIDRRAEAAGRTVDVLVEVNLGEESQKGGARPDEVKALLDAMAGLGHMRVRGLMAIPPASRRSRSDAPALPETARAARPGRARTPVDGHERGLRGRRRGRRHDRPRRHRHLRPSRAPDGSVTIKSKRIGFLGAGNMGEAMIKGLTQAGLVPAASIGATDARADRLDQMTRQYGIRAFANNPALVAESDVIILAVKPQIMAPVLREIAAAVDGTKLIISLAAGVATRTLREHLGRPARLIRVMPNTPALVLEGATAIARAEGLEAGDLEIAQALFGAVGRVVVLDEDHLDAVTGLSGSGPGYIAIVIEALADGGVKMGLDRATAMTLATQTVLGSAQAHPRDGHASGAAQGHGGLAGRDDHRGHRRPRGRRHPPHLHQRRRARDAALAGAGAPVVIELIRFIGWLLDLYSYVIIAAALISWVSPDPRNPIVQFLRQITEPVLAPVRRMLPPWKTGGLDLSPIIVLLAIQFIERVILPLVARPLLY